MRWLVAGLLAFALACGGKVEDAPREKLPAPLTGCAGACERFLECTTSYDRASCQRNCTERFPDPESSGRWESCIHELSCPQIEEGLFADWGVLGDCMARAKRRRQP
jgi:hypothetical protein